MHEADVYVACSRGHVYEQEVELSPTDLQYHLFERIAGHRPSPYECLLRFGEISDGHPLHSVFLYGDYHVPAEFRVVESIGNSPFRACHFRNGRSVYVSVRKTHPVPFPGEGNGQIDCHCGFPYASFA